MDWSDRMPAMERAKMTEHVHEWEQCDEEIGWYSCVDRPECRAMMPPSVVLAHLNKYETLKVLVDKRVGQDYPSIYEVVHG